MYRKNSSFPIVFVILNVSSNVRTDRGRESDGKRVSASISCSFGLYSVPNEIEKVICFHKRDHYTKRGNGRSLIKEKLKEVII
jgi:hypothetical protein